MAILLIVPGTAGGFLNFYLLFQVIPRYAQTGGASSLLAGLCTTAFIAATVGVQPVTTRLFPAAGYPRSLTGGALVLGLGALPMFFSASPALIIACAIVRGTGFGVFVVAAMATITAAMPASRRGLGAGLFGAASGLAGIAGSPAGPWIVSRYGFHAAFAIAALGPLLSVPAGLAVDLPRPARIAAGRIAGAFRTHARPFLIELTCTAAFGVVFTFLPLVIAPGRAWLVSGALLTQQLFAVTARWLAGPWGDRHGSERLLVPAIVLAAGGLCGAVWTAQPVLLLTGMALFGIGFGALQTVTFVAMLKRSPAGEAETSVSIIWNLAFDGGTGIGAACGGVILQFAGHQLLFGISALAMLATLPAARTTTERPVPGTPADECPPRATSLSGQNLEHVADPGVTVALRFSALAPIRDHLRLAAEQTCCLRLACGGGGASARPARLLIPVSVRLGASCELDIRGCMSNSKRQVRTLFRADRTPRRQLCGICALPATTNGPYSSGGTSHRRPIGNMTSTGRHT